MSEDSALLRVYWPEWVIIYVSDQAGEHGRAECQERFASHYEGRIRPADHRVAGPQHQQMPDVPRYHLELRLPNLQGEFTHREDAQLVLSQLPGSVLVTRGSAQERALLDYGVRKLAASHDGAPA